MRAIWPQSYCEIGPQGCSTPTGFYYLLTAASSKTKADTETVKKGSLQKSNDSRLEKTLSSRTMRTGASRCKLPRKLSLKPEVLLAGSASKLSEIGKRMKYFLGGGEGAGAICCRPSIALKTIQRNNTKQIEDVLLRRQLKLLSGRCAHRPRAKRTKPWTTFWMP